MIKVKCQCGKEWTSLDALPLLRYEGDVEIRTCCICGRELSQEIKWKKVF